MYEYLKELPSLLGCSEALNAINIGNFNLNGLVTPSILMIVVITTLTFIIVTVHPIEMWRKTPFMCANLLAVYMFEAIMKCPCEANGYSSLDTN